MNLSTFLGILALLLWSSTIGFSRSISGALGPITTGAVIYTLAGGLATVMSVWQYRGLRPILSLPRRYLWGCGVLFVSYIVCLYLAVGFAADNVQVLVVGLINYLWPALILLLAVPILHKHARPVLLVGISLALAGVTWAMGGAALTLHDFTANLPIYTLMLVGAVCWALYTNLNRRWLGESQVSAVGLFLLASGVVLAVLRLGVQENTQWSASTAAKVVYMVFGPSWLAYTFWDTGTRRGPIILLTALSYLTPLFSTAISIVLLDAPVSPNLWLAALLLVMGAVVCKKGIGE